ncbi:MAG: NTP transferase domain-containing protein [Nanoarchaeota archaeon]|nr:NTP transferase domain-containing protein [Nanoarchaeota archaeon]MBU0962880.1 NTP transferase domain-containing protein [Nanoarchaeota archaeon]
MKVVILCGGEGMRLRELTESIPKPLIEIGDKPILWYILKMYSHYGFNDFILCLGYKKDKIIEYFKDNKSGWNIEFVDTGEGSTKSARLLKIKKYIQDEEFFVSYGDDVSDVNIKNLLEYHKKNKKIVTLTAIHPTINYGIIELDENNMIKMFKEKPKLDHWINGGFFVFNRKIFDYIKEGYELEKEVFENLTKEKQICAFKHDGFWKSMNTFKDYQDLNNMFKSGNTPWEVWK